MPFALPRYGVRVLGDVVALDLGGDTPEVRVWFATFASQSGLRIGWPAGTGGQGVATVLGLFGTPWFRGLPGDRTPSAPPGQQALGATLSGTGTLSAALWPILALTARLDGVGTLDAGDVGVGDVPEASTLTLELREGATVRAVRYLDPDVAVPGESTRWEMLFTDEERATVTDWSALTLALIADGGTQALRVTRVRLTLPL